MPEVFLIKNSALIFGIYYLYIQLQKQMKFYLIITGFCAFLTLHSFGQSIIVKPYLQDVTDQSAKIMFETSTGTTATVLYGVSPFQLNLSADAVSQTGSGSSRIFTSFLPDLTGKTKYYYKVILGNNVQSNVYHFTTLDIPANEQNINFVSISDMQRTGAHPNVYFNLVNSGIIPIMNQEVEGGMDALHGVLIPGDLVQSGGTYSQWKNDFFDLGENLSTIVPLYPSVGNHEYYNDGLGNYLKYFDLPLNGHVNFPEQWWYKDFSNIRVIALNSNSNSSEQALQLSWLTSTMNAVCTDTIIDFVFVQLHAPFKSEMWTPGESNFTGQVVSIMDNFTQTCQKPTIHLFGHTHGYSRGQSKYHEHLWINVATAGGAIDYWGEFPNHDYEEFTHSEDEYGFVLLKGQAGPDPEVLVKRYSRGDDYISKNNELTDSVTLRLVEFPPAKPKPVWPVDSIDFNCATFKASAFFDPYNFHQGSHWQVSTTPDFSTLTADVWKQHENLYQNTDTQVNDDLTDEDDFILNPSQTYYWRIRYRDNYLRWSPWSDTQLFNTRPASTTANLLTNPGAENGITSWNGNIEALTSDQCGSVPVYQGSRFFAVGGICANELAVGNADQLVSVIAYSSEIDNGGIQVWFGGYLRAWTANNDNPQLAVEFINGSGQVISSTPYTGSAQPAWLLVQQLVTVPPSTRRIKLKLKGTRNAGIDNDSYFDELFLKLTTQSACPTCFGDSGTDADQDGICSDLDCDDNNPAKFVGAAESCDGIDNDCDGVADAGDTATWSGNGDGVSWDDPENWDQNLVPLPCQHVQLTLPDTVYMEDYQAIKSLTIGTNAVFLVQENAHLYIHSSFQTGISSMQIAGTFENHGRVDIQHAEQNGIVINGGIIQNNGRIYINSIQQNNILANSNSLLENTGLIINK